MSTTKQSFGLLESLFGKTRRSILALLYTHTDESFYLRKVLRMAGVSPGAGQRELKRLSEAGIILRSLKDNQVYFQANLDCPIFGELRSLITKTVGVTDILRSALDPLAEKIQIALVYGSFARGKAGKDSDVDVLVVGDVSFMDVVDKLGEAQKMLSREINPTVLSPDELQKRVAGEDHLLQSIFNDQYIPIIGDARELRRLVEKRMAR